MKGADGRWYYYYALVDNTRDHGGSAIGVAVAEKAEGPFRDIGRPLITRELAGIRGVDASVASCFLVSPCVVFENEIPYLIFGQHYYYAVELSPSMTALAGPIREIESPSGYAEAPWVYKRGSTWFFHCADGWSESSTVRYATAETMLGPYSDRGVVLPSVGGGTTQNSVCQDDDGDWFCFYHMNDPDFHHRSICVDAMDHHEDGRIATIRTTLPTLHPERTLLYNSLGRREAETFVSSREIQILGPCQKKEYRVQAKEDGAWISFPKYDFSSSPNRFLASYESCGANCKIELRLDSEVGPAVAILELAANCGETEESIQFPALSGVRDLYLVFRESKPDSLSLNWFRFANDP